jgi:hypothetical protein
MVRVRALLVLFAALFVGSPGTVLAHDGVSHSDAERSAAGQIAELLLSPLCPPGPGHVCGCGNLLLCEGSAKPALLVRWSVSLLPPRLNDVPELHAATAWPSPRFPPSLSRAPPQLS